MSPQVLLKNPIIVFFKEKAKEMDLKIFVVGGIPRDLIMGKENFKDYDFVVMSDPLRLAKEFKRYFNSKIAYYSDFKTVEIEFEGKNIDIAMARREHYLYPGSLPSVEKTTDINEDLSRRDFTINSIAIELSPEFGRTYDPFKGEEDIKDKKIRVLNKNSFYEDPTRAFRAIRYKNRLDFHYTEDTEKEFTNYEKSIKNVKFPRIKKELELISCEEKRDRMWREIAVKNMLYFFNENLNLGEDLIDDLSEILPFEKNSWICFFYLFLNNNPPAVFDYLSNKEKKIIDQIRKGNKNFNRGGDVLELHPVLKKFEELSLMFLSVKEKDILSYIEKKKSLRKLLKGNEIIEMGFEKALVEKIKTLIEIKQMKGEIKTRDDAFKFLRENRDELQGSLI